MNKEDKPLSVSMVQKLLKSGVPVFYLINDSFSDDVGEILETPLGKIKERIEQLHFGFEHNYKGQFTGQITLITESQSRVEKQSTRIFFLEPENGIEQFNDKHSLKKFEGSWFFIRNANKEKTII